MSESDSSEEEEVVVQSLVAGRARRSTAGAKIAKLLDNEEEDEFYKSTYGGFNEEEDDNDYHSEGSDDDQVDSDFDIDENDELKSDGEDDGEGKRKKKGVSTKAYKEPVKRKEAPEKKKEAVVKKKRKVEGRSSSNVHIYHSSGGKKTLRKTTSERTKEAEVKRKETEAKKQMMKDIARKKNVAEVRRLTQEELLEEAKITEEINLRSLETYHRLELERKKTRVVKQAYRGPMIRYHSVSMPLLEELPEDSTQKREAGKERCSRTFITFTDETTAAQIFPCHQPKPVTKSKCPITLLAAKYFDPLTKTPFANVYAFKYIRANYLKQMEDAKRKTKGN